MCLTEEEQKLGINTTEKRAELVKHYYDAKCGRHHSLVPLVSMTISFIILLSMNKLEGFSILIITIVSMMVVGIEFFRVIKREKNIIEELQQHKDREDATCEIDAILCEMKECSDHHATITQRLVDLKKSISK